VVLWDSLLILTLYVFQAAVTPQEYVGPVQLQTVVCVLEVVEAAQLFVPQAHHCGVVLLLADFAVAVQLQFGEVETTAV
jgi:hypothetical protein